MTARVRYQVRLVTRLDDWDNALAKMEPLVIILMVLVVVLVVALTVAQYAQLRKQQPDASLSTALQNLTQAVQGTHTQAAVLSEKVEPIEKLPSLVGDMQVELKGLSERLSTVEKNQTSVAGGVNSLQTSGNGECGVFFKSLSRTAAKKTKQKIYTRESGSNRCAPYKKSSAPSS
jgi:predicted PurR-regulated permease PerM